MQKGWLVGVPVGGRVGVLVGLTVPMLAGCTAFNPFSLDDFMEYVPPEFQRTNPNVIGAPVVEKSG